jgi:hypothetical protein
LAARGLQANRKTLALFKDVVRDGNGGFHTKSMTG